VTELNESYVVWEGRRESEFISFKDIDSRHDEEDRPVEVCEIQHDWRGRKVWAGEFELCNGSNESKGQQVKRSMGR